MFTLLRQSPRCPRLRLTRSFAEVVPVSVSQRSELPPTGTDTSSSAGSTSPVSSSQQVSASIGSGQRIPVRGDHGLYGFFRKKVPAKDEVLEGEARYETLGGSLYSERAQSGTLQP